MWAALLWMVCVFLGSAFVSNILTVTVFERMCLCIHKNDDVCRGNNLPFIYDKCDLFDYTFSHECFWTEKEKRITEEGVKHSTGWFWIQKMGQRHSEDMETHTYTEREKKNAKKKNKIIILNWGQKQSGKLRRHIPLEQFKQKKKAAANCWIE